MKSFEVEDLFWYHGANRTKGKNHLALQGWETSLCGQVPLEYNRRDELNENKAFKFKGLDSVVGKVCNNCRRLYNKSKGENK